KALQNAILSREQSGRVCRLLGSQQTRPSVSGLSGRLAERGGGCDLDLRVSAQTLRLPRLVVGPKERPLAVDRDADRRTHAGAVSLVRGQEDGSRSREALQRRRLI